ncbi:MAG: propanediol utilization protein, partial [Clostridia bacterium]|nr:propanediol utilization protein [Clostridia bacterium]
MEKKILIETSARHVHLSREDMDVLFGKGAELTVKKDLSQPGQYISFERVDVVGPKKTIASVGIIGPLRPHTQVEVSLTDARTLGVSAAVRESGKTEGTEGIKLVGPAGEVELPDGVIAAK